MASKYRNVFYEAKQYIYSNYNYNVSIFVHLLFLLMDCEKKSQISNNSQCESSCHLFINNLNGCSAFKHLLIGIVLGIVHTVY